MDVNVLILFFNRADSLQQVFNAVRQAQPARLFLYQDGPRGEKDVPGIMACRDIVSHVDWECEVYTRFEEVNHGCDPSEFLSQQWAFSMVEKCIVLEDDDVPTTSFFAFCKEMLDRYEHDERVGMIAGFNTEEHTTDCGADDYFFTSNFSIWGWASWRRVVQRWDEAYTWLDDPQAVARIEALTKERKLRRDFLPMCRAHKASGKAFYETIFHAHMLLSNQLAIVPRVNMISNLGVTDNSTHFAGSVHTLPAGYRRIFTMQRHELAFPLHHPRHVVDHVAYRQRVYRIMAWEHPWLKAARSLEELWLNLRHGQWRRIASALGNRLRIACHGRRFH